MDWMKIREDAYRITKEIQEKPLTQFLNEMDMHDIFYYEYTDMNRKLLIYTKHPGIWIGFRGKGVERLKEILKENFEHDVIVDFKELKGNFLSI